MAEPVDATYLSEQEASDMLHKYGTESTKLKAILVVTATGFPIVGMPTLAQSTGTLKNGPGEMLSVISADGGITASLTFDPRAAIAVTWGDNRQVSAQRVPGFPSLESGLVFRYEGYAVALFDISAS